MASAFKRALFATSVAEIQEAYSRLGHQRGWRFLATPRRTLIANAPVAFVTLNPGGSLEDPAHGVASCEAGSAYVHERWNANAPGESPLQQQVRSMFAWLGRDPETTLSAYFVPFRSPSLKKLVAPRQSIAFGVQLWCGILAEVRAPVVVCLGADVEKWLILVLGKPRSVTTLLVGWGKVTARLNRFDSRVLLRLPHLSRFRIFSRPASKSPLRLVRDQLDRDCAELGVRL